MSDPSGAPAGVPVLGGVSHHPSRRSVVETVQQLVAEIEDAGAKLFMVIDQAAEAKKVGLGLRQTHLILFGNPVAGTPVMQAAPLTALDLPLKILVWADDDGQVWMSHVDADWLVARYGLSQALAKPLGAAGVLASKASSD
ncbi:MAG TPA: DUF302 domain-containing protein [Acidimicrobiales bacterium]|nr:DUF302 domain-containing protein [Acidimicrobiales bacterium]